MLYRIYLPDLKSKFNGAKTVLKAIRHEGLIEEIPSYFEEELALAESLYEEAKKKPSDGNDGGALEKMKEAVRHASNAFYEAVRLYLLGLFQKVRKVRDSFKGYEDLALQYIPRYSEHNKNFGKIKEVLESDERIEGDQFDHHRKQLKDFLNDFESVREELSVAINREEENKRDREEAKREATKRFWIGTGLTCVVIFLSIITIVVMVKGCGDSSQQVTQPEPSDSEAGLQSAENNPTLTS